MKGRVWLGIVVLIAVALLAAGCGAAKGDKGSTGAPGVPGGAPGAGAAVSGQVPAAGGAGVSAQREAVLKTPAGAAVQKEVEGLQQDLDKLTTDTPVDPDAGTQGF